MDLVFSFPSFSPPAVAPPKPPTGGLDGYLESSSDEEDSDGDDDGIGDFEERKKRLAARSKAKDENERDKDGEESGVQGQENYPPPLASMGIVPGFGVRPAYDDDRASNSRADANLESVMQRLQEAIATSDRILAV